MITKFGMPAASLAVIALALLSACSPSPASHPASPVAAAPAPPPAAGPAKPRAFTLNTPVERIAADPLGKAVLQRDVPGLMTDKRYPMFDDLSLSQIATLSHGRLTSTRLALVQSDLNALDPLAPAPVSGPGP